MAADWIFAILRKLWGGVLIHAIMDFSWFEQIDYHEEEGIVFFASGVFYYFKKEDVKKLFTAMAKRFKGVKIIGTLGVGFSVFAIVLVVAGMGV